MIGTFGRSTSLDEDRHGFPRNACFLSFLFSLLLLTQGLSPMSLFAHCITSLYLACIFWELPEVPVRLVLLSFLPVFCITDLFFLLFKNFPCGFVRALRDQGYKHTCLFLSSWDPHKLVLWEGDRGSEVNALKFQSQKRMALPACGPVPTPDHPSLLGVDCFLVLCSVKTCTLILSDKVYSWHLCRELGYASQMS